MNSFRDAVAMSGVLAMLLVGNTYGQLAESRFAPGEQVAELEHKKVKESSGIAPSRIAHGRFWTHNDSGDKPRLFAFDRAGKHLGTSRIDNASSKDWEDMSSCTIDGKHYLVIGDVGDNGRRRKSYKIFIAPEPTNPKRDTEAEIVIKFTFEDDRQNCEALAVDTRNRQILLAAKSVSLASRIYSLPWPNESTDDAIAKKIGVVPIPVITGMDISADGLNLACATYIDGYEIRRKSTEAWADAFLRPPTQLIIPPRKQGEAICYGPLGKSLYLTSERVPAPLIRLQLK